MFPPRKSFVRVSAALLATTLAATGCGSSGAPGAKSTSTPATTARSSSAPVTTPSTSPKSTPKPTAAQIRAKVNAAVAKIEARQPSGAVSVAALNTVTGARYSAGATSGMWTASAYKLFVLEAVLLHSGSLSDAEVSQATTALENSDNVAGYSLFLEAGGIGGLSSAAARFGMTHTVPGRSDPTFTTTSASDYLKLLQNLVSSTSPFSEDTREFVLGLMRNVEADQRWGVGVTADKGSTFYNKNGWLSVDDSNGYGEADNGLWIATSVGIVTIKGQQVLMAVLTRHQQSYATGVALVQKLARTIAPAVSKS